MGMFQVRILEWVAMPSLPGDLPNPGMEPRSPALPVDSLLSELPGKPKGIIYILNRRVKIKMSQVQSGKERKELRNSFSQHGEVISAILVGK